MKYSSTLIKKFISVDDSPDNIANNLILKTCEIEEVHKREFDDELVVGKVTSFAKHPDADKLNVCQVDCGKKGNFEIICGGTNIAEGIYVPAALPGCYLAAVDIKIEPRKMRGVTSNGMICSKQELGINEDVDEHRIRSLTEDFDDIGDEDLGKAMKEKYPWMEGYVLEVDNKSLTNRPDLSGHRGISTELNAIYAGNDDNLVTFNKITDRYKQFQDTSIVQTLDNSSQSKRKVVSKTDGLNSYILMEINNVTVETSSFFTRLQMLDMDAVPRSNWVDFSNLFMLISGQPIHFFDADKVEGDLMIRNAKEGEEFVDLFETNHNLKDTDLVIADGKKILALAGVVGGLDGGVTDTTKNILVEIANFDPVAVRKTGTRLGLRTDAELRFEKNINPVYSLSCLLLFLDELKYYAKDLGSYKIGGLSYFASKEVLDSIKSPKIIDLNYEGLSKFVFGQKIGDLDKKHKDFEMLVQKYLEGIGFILGKKGNWTVPFWRSPGDINIVEDIYEEVARLYGYDNIPELPVSSPLNDVPYSPYVGLNRALEDILVRNFACSQTETYPWISEKTLNDFGIDKKTLYVLENPVNPEMPYMRDNMLYGLLAHITKNSKFFDVFKIFDIGKIWNKSSVTSDEGRGTSEKKLETRYSKLDTAKHFASEFVNERGQVGIMVYQKNIKTWDADPLLASKDMVRTICKQLGLDQEIVFDKTENINFHPKKQANIMIAESRKQKAEKINVGFIGSLHPLLLKNYKIPEHAGVVYISLDMNQLIALLGTSENDYRYESLQDQIVWRDLCFVIDSQEDFGGIIDAVKGVNGVNGVEVFDVYSGENLGDGKKSVALKMKILGDPAATRGAGGTMTTEQINAVMNTAIKAGEAVGAKLRD